MPRTPAAARPIGRTSSSWKRIACPDRDTITMSSSPLVGMTRTSSSSSRSSRAMMPARSDESYSVKRVFFTVPCRVAKNRYRLVS